MKVFVAAIICFVVVNGFPQNMTDEVKDVFNAETGSKAGIFFSKLPSILNMTSNWLMSLSKIGEDIDPDFGMSLRAGAEAIKNGSAQIPSDLANVVVGTIQEGISIFNSTYNGVKEGIIDQVVDFQEDSQNSTQVESDIKEVHETITGIVNGLNVFAESINKNMTTGN